jgi:hypothetical protein
VRRESGAAIVAYGGPMKGLSTQAIEKMRWRRELG